MPPAQDAPAPNWTPIDNAARLSGKSDRTLRRWVASGKLAHKREAGRLFVDLSSPALASPDSDIAVPNDSDIATLRQQVDTLTNELAVVKAVLDEVRGERDYLRQLNAMKEARQLEAQIPRRAWRWWPWSKTEG